MQNNLLKYSIVLVALVSGAGTASAQKIKVVRDADSANILTVKKAGDLAVSVENDSAGKSTLKLSSDKHYEASVFCVPSRSSEVTDCVHRVFIVDLQEDEQLEIVGEELFIEANRMIDNLKWIDDHTLSYERWVGPHFGHRYVVDLKTMKQTGAFTLSDQ